MNTRAKVGGWLSAIMPMLLGVLLAVMLGGWAQDVLYERRVRDFRDSVWAVQSAVSAGVYREDYREILQAARHEQLRARARVFQWDIRRASWHYLNRALGSFEQAGREWDTSEKAWNYERRDNATAARQAAWTAASDALHSADLERRDWWWGDMPLDISAMARLVSQ